MNAITASPCHQNQDNIRVPQIPISHSMNILITGASRGIGRSTALLASTQRGWNVGLNYNRSQSEATSAIDIIERHSSAIPLQGDITNETDVLRMFDSFEKAYGTIDGVVINAGITAKAMPLAEMDVERLRKMFDTNILGAYLCAREAARRLKRGGSIVIVSSGASKLGSPNEYVDYAGSKGAMDSLTVGLSKELGPTGVRVNAVRPGAIKTEIHETTGDPGRVDRIGGQTPLGRAGEADEVAQAIVWLLSSDSSYVSGALLDVAGGR